MFCPLHVKAETIQAIRDRIQIEEIIGDAVSLKRKGKTFWGLCPFHSERTPSFTVSPEKNMFYCFGCKKGGDAITFLKELRGLDYLQAMLELAERYAIPMRYEREDGGASGRSGLRESLGFLFEYAAGYYHDSLVLPCEGSGHSQGLDYLSGRGIQSDTLTHYRIGYAQKTWDSFFRCATGASYGEEFMLQAGLCRKKKDRIYDVFRHRIIFPIWDVLGHVVAFGGRSLSGTDTPKYINLSDTSFYKKGRHLYGLHQAKSAIKARGVVYLVEGYMDVLAVYQAGIPHVVSPLGTALTREQARLLKRFAEKVVLLFDGDASGVDASLRAIDLLLAEQVEVSVVLLPPGMDPDDYVTREGGDSFLRYVEEKEMHFISFMWSQLASQLSDWEGESARLLAAQRIVKTIAKSPGPLMRASLLRVCAEETKFSEAVLSQELAHMMGEGPAVIHPESLSAQEKEKPLEVEKPLYRQEWGCLCFLLRHGEKKLVLDGEEVPICAYFFKCLERETRYFESVFKSFSFTETLHGKMLATIREQVAAGTWRGHEHFAWSSEEEKEEVAAALLSEPAVSERWREKTGYVSAPNMRELRTFCHAAIIRLARHRWDYANAISPLAWECLGSGALEYEDVKRIVGGYEVKRMVRGYPEGEQLEKPTITKAGVVVLTSHCHAKTQKT